MENLSDFIKKMISFLIINLIVTGVICMLCGRYDVTTSMTSGSATFRVRIPERYINEIIPLASSTRVFGLKYAFSFEGKTKSTGHACSIDEYVDNKHQGTIWAGLIPLNNSLTEYRFLDGSHEVYLDKFRFSCDFYQLGVDKIIVDYVYSDFRSGIFIFGLKCFFFALTFPFFYFVTKVKISALRKSLSYIMFFISILYNQPFYDIYRHLQTDHINAIGLVCFICIVLVLATYTKECNSAFLNLFTLFYIMEYFVVMCWFLYPSILQKQADIFSNIKVDNFSAILYIVLTIFLLIYGALIKYFYDPDIRKLILFCVTMLSPISLFFAGYHYSWNKYYTFSYIFVSFFVYTFPFVFRLKHSNQTLNIAEDNLKPVKQEVSLEGNDSSDEYEDDVTNTTTSSAQSAKSPFEPDFHSEEEV